MNFSQLSLTIDVDVDIRNLILEYEVMEGLSTKNKDSLLFAYF